MHDHAYSPDQRDARLEALLQVTEILGSRVEFQQILDTITLAAQTGFQCGYVSIMLLNEETAELEVCSVAGDEAKSILGHKQKLGEGVAGHVAQEGKPLVLGGRVDSREFRDYRERRTRPSASMVVPIVLREELIGVLAINAMAPGQRYHDDDLRILQIFASIVGVCIRHYQQAEWMRETIRGLQSVLESQGEAA